MTSAAEREEIEEILESMGGDAEIFSETFMQAYNFYFETPAIAIVPFFTVVSVIGTLLYLLIFAVIIHVCLMICGAANYDMESTIRALAFCMAAVMPLELIPLCGPLIGLCWLLIIILFSLVDIHRTSIGRVLIALHLPLLPFFCCLAALISLLIIG